MHLNRWISALPPSIMHEMPQGAIIKATCMKQNMLFSVNPLQRPPPFLSSLKNGLSHLLRNEVVFVDDGDVNERWGRSEDY